MKETKEQKIIWKIYKEISTVATTPCDFDELINSAEKDKKQIPYNDYKILEKDYIEILERNLKGQRLTKLKQQALRNSVAMGVSPKFKKEN